MTFFDFTSDMLLSHSSSNTIGEGVANVFGTNRFIPVDGLCAETRVQQMCPPLSWQLPSKKVFLLRTISLLGFCPIDLSLEKLAMDSADTVSDLHGGGSPAAHRLTIMRESDLNARKNCAKRLAGIE